MDKNTKPKPFCFVLMPFDESFSDIYELGIKQACLDAGGYCERVDEQIFEERILDRIYNQISKADVVIADMTGKNANVFYEVGYAHALGRRTILLTQQADDIPFDMKHFTHIVYNKKIVTIKDELTKRIKWYFENPEKRDDEKLAIEVFESRVSLSKNKREIIAEEGILSNVKIELDLLFMNQSPLTLGSGDFQVGIICSKNLSHANIGWDDDYLSIIKTPDSSRVAMLPPFESIFPSGYKALLLNLYFKEMVDFENITVRIYSHAGTRDFYLTIKKVTKEIIL